MARRRSHALLLLLVLLPAVAAAAGTFRRPFQPDAQTTESRLQETDKQQAPAAAAAAMNPVPVDLFPYGAMVQAQQQAQESQELAQSPYSSTPPPTSAPMAPHTKPPRPAPDPAPPMDRVPVTQQTQQAPPGQPPAAGPSAAGNEAAVVLTKEDLYLKDAEMGGFYFDESPEPTAVAPPGATSPADMALPIGPRGRRGLAEQEEDGAAAEEEREDPFANGDAVMELMHGDSAALALKSVRAAATSLARQGIAAAERKAGVGAGAIASPAVLSVPHPVLGVQRAVFVGFKRIGALNVDFNLPVSAYDRFGTSCAVLLPQGDLDHDATSVEVAVGAPGDHTYQKKQGAVYIIFLSNFGELMYL
jgi:hypothetical protein